MRNRFVAQDGAGTCVEIANVCGQRQRLVDIHRRRVLNCDLAGTGGPLAARLRVDEFADRFAGLIGFERAEPIDNLEQRVVDCLEGP